MISSIADLCIRWWREATGPLNRSQHRTLGAAIMRRILVWTPVLVLAAIVFGALGFYLFTGWRARDLTAKALANAEAGNARFARLQISSAASLRPDDPAVKRAFALVESQLGNPDAVQAWEEIGWEADLNPDEIDARAESMARHGSEEQFVRAVEALEKQGDTVRAAELRSIRSLRGGDMEQAIAQARAAAAKADAEPRLRLQLLQLLARRYGVFLTAPSRAGAQDLAAAREMSALIDGLVDTPVGDEALAFGLEAPYFPPGKKSAWAAAAWKNAQAANPALLPAAEFLAVSGTEPATDLYNKLNVLFIGAPLPQQVVFARWMLNRGMHEQVLITASATEAAQDEGMFGARAAALAALGRWEELYRLADTPSKAPDALRLMSKALAADKLGRRGEAEELGRNALLASVKEGRVEQAITLADSQNMRALADRAIIAMCGNAAVADGAFRLARDRFSRRGQFATLDEAYTAARQAAPSGTAVRDYGLYRDLLGGAGVEPSVTAEALASAPTAVEARFNHALALLQAGQGEEALAVFEDFDVIVEQLPPGLRAVAAAVLAAGGDANGGMTAARTIDPHLLTPAEFALIAKWRTGP
ncbi:MAG: hypothetical protein ACO3RX_06455 [Chthoniobacterales bacterium]